LLNNEHNAGDIISYMEMCSSVGVNLQRGMNFRLHNGCSIILMSLRPGAPYADRIENDGRVLIYEGHDIAKIPNGPSPKQVINRSVTPTVLSLRTVSLLKL
jgi:hypothetical protein